MGLGDRERLRIVLASFQAIQMWTLTVDPKRFGGPELAYRYVMKKRLLARWVAKLKALGFTTGRYYWVIEFHKSGWPHWHLILETSYVPFDAASSLWQRLGTGNDRDYFGHVLFSRGKGSKDGRFASAVHAARYVTKYVIKEPEHGWPQWVLNYGGNIMRCRGSNRLFVPHDEPAGVPAEKPKGKERGAYVRKKTVRLRVAQCGQQALIYVKREYGCRYIGRLPYGGDDLELWFGQALHDVEVPRPGLDDAVDRLLWAWLGFVKKKPGRLVEVDGELLIRDVGDVVTHVARRVERPIEESMQVAVAFDDPEWMGED